MEENDRDQKTQVSNMTVSRGFADAIYAKNLGIINGNVLR